MKQVKAHNPMPTIHLEKIYNHPPERVWQALTNPHALAEWLLPNTFKPQLGHRFRLLHRSGAGRREKIHCQVVEIEAPRRLAYTWQAESEETPTLVTWTLESIEDGTCLRLEHTGIKSNSLEQNSSHVQTSIELSHASHEDADSITSSLLSYLQSSGLTTCEPQPQGRQSTSRANTSPFVRQVGRINLGSRLQSCRCIRQSLRIADSSDSNYDSLHSHKEVLLCAR